MSCNQRSWLIQRIGREHHVLHGTRDIGIFIAVILLVGYDDEDESVVHEHIAALLRCADGPAEVVIVFLRDLHLRELLLHERDELLQDFLLADHDKAALILVLAARCLAARLDDLVEYLLRHRFLFEFARAVARGNAGKDIHGSALLFYR